jgi:hypothetical protein
LVLPWGADTNDKYDAFVWAMHGYSSPLVNTGGEAVRPHRIMPALLDLAHGNDLALSVVPLMEPQGSFSPINDPMLLASWSRIRTQIFTAEIRAHHEIMTLFLRRDHVMEAPHAVNWYIPSVCASHVT